MEVEVCGSDKDHLSDQEYTKITNSMGIDVGQSGLSDTQKHELLG